VWLARPGWKNGCQPQALVGTRRAGHAYRKARHAAPQSKLRERVTESEKVEVLEMKDTWKVVGTILLGLFVLVVGIPLVFAAIGLGVAVLGTVIGLAILLIKLAVVLAIGYLVLAGIRALLR
jgi:hypothetical protein